MEDQHESRVLRRTPRTLHVFTDGACFGNGSKDALAGYGVHFPHEEYDDISEPFSYKPCTNQRAELYAIYHALTIGLNDEAIDDVFVYSDSDYSIKCIKTWAPGWHKANWTRKTGGPLKNLDIIKPLYRLYSYNRDRVHFIHVRSHTGNTDDWSVGNDKADILAGKGALSTLSEEERVALKAKEKTKAKKRSKKPKGSFKKKYTKKPKMK